jgi:hypothetical protein
MSRFAKFSEFKNIKPLLEKANSEDMIEVNYIISELDNDSIIEEGFLDDLKTGASKILFGSFSKAGMIDDLRKKLLDLEIKFYDTKFELSDEIDNLEDELAKASKEKNDSMASALKKQLDAKNQEKTALVGSHKANVKRVYDLLDKLITKSSRLREYWETTRAEDEYKLEQAKYQVLKNRSADAERLSKQKLEIEKAKKDAEEAAEKFKAELAKGSKKDDKPKSSGIDSEREGKIIKSGKPKSIIQRKKDIGIEIANLKADLEEVLEKARKKIIKGQASENIIKKFQRDAIEIAVILDSKINLLNLYKEMGKNEEEIRRNASKSSKIKDLTDKINKATSSQGGTSGAAQKTVQDAFSGTPSSSKIDKATSDLDSFSIANVIA